MIILPASQDDRTQPPRQALLGASDRQVGRPGHLPLAVVAVI